MKKTILLTILVIAFAFSGCLSAFAQVDVSSATIKGTVTDQNKAVVVGAIVTAKSTERGTIRTAKTGNDGSYVIPTLQPGVYEVRIEAPGFEAAVVPNAEITVGATAVYDVELQPGGVKAQVEVTSESPVIEVERTQQANTIDKRAVENLPNVGRTFQSYVYSLPGVSNSNAPRAQLAGRVTGFLSSGFSIGGSNGRNNLITVDGGENEYGSGQVRFDIGTESIQEFQVNRNSFSAEFGFTAGTAVNVITRSGSNKFHGSGYIFYRSDHTSARNFFDFTNPRASDRQLFPGFTFGGPIVKNKLFFFTNYERNMVDAARFRFYTTNALLQPNAAQFALLNTLDSNPSENVRRISANLRTALTTTQATYPNTWKILSENEGTFNGLLRFNNWSTRVDYQLTDHDSINGRFTLTRNFTDDIGTNNGTSPSVDATLTYRDYSSVVTWTHNFGAKIVNQLRGQISPGNSAVTAPPEPAQVGMLISNLGGFGRTFGAPYIVHQWRAQFEDTLTWIRGTHTFKFGGSYRPVHYNFRNDLWFAGEYQFTSFALYTISLAVPSGADRTAFVAAAGAAAAATPLTSLQNFNLNLPFLYRQGFNNSTWEGTGHYVGGFAQDTWKVHPRLTLDIGGRIDWDGEPPPVPRHAYFSPRFGFAWQITGDGKTVLRGGSGVFYSPIYIQIPGYTSILNGSGQYINQIARSPLNGVAALWQTGVAQGKYPFSILTEADINALGISTAAGAPGRVLFDLNPDYKNNYAIQANLGIQRQLTNSISVEVAYQMYHGVHIQQPVGLNYCEAGTPGCPATNAAQQAALLTRNTRVLGPLYRVCSTGVVGQTDTQCGRVNDAGITQFTDYQSRGMSIYHGVAFQLMKRFSNYFSFQTSYTYSKAIDDQTDFNSAFAPPFPSRLDTERSLSTFDIRHNFVISGIFTSPFKSGPGHNWASRAFADMTLSPVVLVRSGIPFTIRTGTDINGDTRAGTDRLYYIGRNTGIGPDFRSVNMRISKVFRFKADRSERIEFSVDGGNLFNRTNFGSVNEIVPTAFEPLTINGQPNPRAGEPTAIDYLSDTVRLKGRRDRDFRKGEPLSFTTAFAPRQLLFGLKFSF
jgi:hypothetical protein